MKEFIYTCEHCGTQYTITDPGKYQCSNCNNVFTVEDQEQKQAKRLEPIRRKAEAQATAIQPIQYAKPVEQRRKKFNLSNIGLALLILYSFHRLLLICAIGNFETAGEFYFSLIAICVYVLLQKIEQNTRKGE